MSDRQGPGGEAINGSRGLHLALGERISAITGKVGPIVATGNNQFDRDKKAMSVQDVEEALRPLLAEAGVVINWSVTTAAVVDKLWRLDFHVTVYNADDLTDKLEADWMDVGNSPSAAASFAVKGYYRRLFHLADTEDQVQIPGAETKKPATLRKYEAEIKKMTLGPDQPAQAEPVRDALAEPASADLSDIYHLAATLKIPWDEKYVQQELKKGAPALRRRLILEHGRDCGTNACQHVAELAGLVEVKK